MKTLFLGDVSPTELNLELYREKNLPLLFGDTLPLFEDRDFTFVNLECALTDHDVPIAKFGPPLKAPSETAEVLRTLGVDCCGLSNNHVFDFGVKGIRDTTRALEEQGLGWTGFGEDYRDSRKNYTVEKNGERMAVIAVCEHEYSYALEDRMGSRPFDEFETMEDIRRAKETHHRVAVIYHGGKELCMYPSPRLRRVCRAMARNGADLVLCQHSHCIGAYEEYEGCHILYGQGNSHFVKDYKTPLWHSALMVTYDTASHEIGFLPTVATDVGIRQANDEERDRILRAFEERNQSLHDGSWKDGWHAFCEENKELYLRVIRLACSEESNESRYARFGHYLDCEAHTDVWRELFPTYNQTNERNG